MDDLYSPTAEETAYHQSHAAEVDAGADKFDDCPICFGGMTEDEATAYVASRQGIGSTFD